MTALDSSRLWIGALALAACSSSNNTTIDGPPAIDAPAAAAKVARTDLVADVAPTGETADAKLLNPWGLAFNPAGPIWVADNHSGVATVYDPTGTIIPLVVTLPVPAGDTDPAAPTGQKFNATATDFMGDKFILSSEDGTIVGWQTGTTATMRADNSAAGAIYKGFDILDTGAGRVIVAANFAKNTVDVFDSTYHAKTLAGGTFTDPNEMPGYAPFNVRVAGDNVFISYAKQDDQMEDDVAGPGNGAISVFDKTGAFVRRLITGGVLNSPWAMTLAPTDYPSVGGNLLVGNFGDGRISAIDVTTGATHSQLQDDQSAPISIAGLWDVEFGPVAATHLQMFFSAGPNHEANGVVGRLDVAP